MKQREPAYFGYWIDYFELEHDFKWEKNLLFKFNYIKENRIKQFNFKFLHKILPSKDNLLKWNITNDNKCDICKCEDTTMHLLLKCKKVKILWKIVERMIFYIFQKQVEINDRSMIIGFNISEKKNLMINLIINFAQFLIYKK